jgi:hypothetical protein
MSNSHCTKPPGENFAVNSVTIPNQVFGRPFPTASLGKLPSNPFGRWMGRHSQSTEEFVGRLPYGNYVLKALAKLNSMLPYY